MKSNWWVCHVSSDRGYVSYRIPREQSTHVSLDIVVFCVIFVIFSQTTNWFGVSWIEIRWNFLPSKWLSGRVGTTSSQRPFRGTICDNTHGELPSEQWTRPTCAIIANKLQAVKVLFHPPCAAEIWPSSPVGQRRHRCTRWSSAPRWGKTQFWLQRWPCQNRSPEPGHLQPGKCNNITNCVVTFRKRPALCCLQLLLHIFTQWCYRFRVQTHPRSRAGQPWDIYTKECWYQLTHLNICTFQFSVRTKIWSVGPLLCTCCRGTSVHVCKLAPIGLF